MNQGKWVRKSKNGLNVVFIHGINSGEGCWRNKNKSYWPELLKNESELADIGIYVFSYRTGINTGSYSLSDIVDSLREYFILDSLISSKGVIFVCHSMGGIVTRRFLVNQHSMLIERKLNRIALFLVASPSLGSEYANMLGLISSVIGHTQASALKFSQNNVWLNDLDKDFINLKTNNKDLKIRGKELIEDLPLYGKGFIRKQIVEPFSGAKYFGNSFKVPGSDHSTIATPANSNAIQHRLLVQFIKDFIEEEFNFLSSHGISKDDFDSTTYQGVFISKLFNPPGSESGSQSRIWIGCDGKYDIYFESVRVIHQKGMSASVGTGRNHVDERLKYSFKFGSDITHLLDPMLTIDPKDQRELVFDLELTPEGYFGSVGGNVIVILNYHTSKGTAGQIPLIERKQKGIFAQILESPIVDFIDVSTSSLMSEKISYVVNERGLIYGNDDIDDLPVLNFQFMKSFYWNYLKTREIEDKDIVFNWFKKVKNREELLAEILNGNIYASELGIFSDNKNVIRSFLKLSENDEFFHDVCRNLALSELIGKERNIHNFIQNNVLRIKNLRPNYFGSETNAIELLLMAAYIKDEKKFSCLKVELIKHNCYVNEIEGITKLIANQGLEH